MSALPRKFQRLIRCVGAVIAAVFLFLFMYRPAAKGLVVVEGSYADALAAGNVPFTAVSAYRQNYAPDRGNTLLIDEAQAVALTQAKGLRFLPQYLSTILIVSDETRTDETPDSYKALLSCVSPVAIDLSRFTQTLLSLSRALGGATPALQYLRTLKEQGRLVEGRDAKEALSRAPLALLADDCLNGLAADPSALSRCVPSEGGLALAYGLVGVDPAQPVADALLQANGLRVLNADPAALDPAVGYERAERVDPERFAKAAQGLYARYRREVQHVRLFTMAQAGEYYLAYALFAMVLCVWGYSLFMRVARRRLRRILLLQACLLIGLILLRFLKLLTGDETLLWYLYYLPLLSSPLLFLLACRASDGRIHSRRVTGLLCGGTTLSILLVLTNDLHEWVFQLSGNDTGDYGYGFCYWLVVAYAAALTIWGMTLLFRRAADANSLRLLIAPTSMLLLFLLYLIGYALQTPITQGEFCFNASAFICLVWELCMDTGFFAVNVRYPALFRCTNVPIWLLDRELSICRSSDCAGELPVLAKKAAAEGRAHLSSDDGRLSFDVTRLKNAYVIWRTDASALAELRQTLKERAAELSNRNELLAQEAQLRIEAAKLAQRGALVSELESAMSDKLQTIRRLTDSLSDPLRPADKQTLIRIKLSIGCCKRMGNLLLTGAGTGQTSVKLLGLLLDESLTDLKVGGLNGSVFYGEKGVLPTANAVALFECFSDVLSALADTSASLYARLLPQGDALCLAVICDAPDAKNAPPIKSRPNVTLSCAAEEDALLIRCLTGGYADA